MSPSLRSAYFHIIRRACPFLSSSCLRGIVAVPGKFPAQKRSAAQKISPQVWSSQGPQQCLSIRAGNPYQNIRLPLQSFVALLAVRYELQRQPNYCLRSIELDPYVYGSLHATTRLYRICRYPGASHSPGLKGGAPTLLAGEEGTR